MLKAAAEELVQASASSRPGGVFLDPALACKVSGYGGRKKLRGALGPRAEGAGGVLRLVAWATQQEVAATSTSRQDRETTRRPHGSSTSRPLRHRPLRAAPRWLARCAPFRASPTADPMGRPPHGPRARHLLPIEGAPKRQPIRDSSRPALGAAAFPRRTCSRAGPPRRRAQTPHAQRRTTIELLKIWCAMCLLGRARDFRARRIQDNAFQGRADGKFRQQRAPCPGVGVMKVGGGRLRT